MCISSPCETVGGSGRINVPWNLYPASPLSEKKKKKLQPKEGERGRKKEEREGGRKEEQAGGGISNSRTMANSSNNVSIKKEGNNRIWHQQQSAGI